MQTKYGIIYQTAGFPRVPSNETFRPFPQVFLTKSQFYWLFAAWKYDNLTFVGIHTSQTDAKKKKNSAATIWQKNKYDFSFSVLYQLNHDIINKMSIIIEIRFLIFLHILLVTVRLNNHITTLTVKMWNEAFILISTPFFLTFSWHFGEFQNYLTHIKIYWLFPDFFRFKLFPFSWPVGTLNLQTNCYLKLISKTWNSIHEISS